MDSLNGKKIHSGILVSITIFFVFLGVVFWATTPVDSASSVEPKTNSRSTIPKKRVPILKLNAPMTRISGTGVLYKKYPQGSSYLSVVQFASLPYEPGSDKTLDFLAKNSVGVFLRPDVTIASLNSFLREMKAEVIGFSGGITRYLSLRISKVASVKELFSKLSAIGNTKKYPFIELAVPAIQFMPMMLDTQGNDHWSSYYDFDNETKGSNKSLKMTKLLSAANARFLCDNPKYATVCNKGFSTPYTLVVDSGLDTAHPDNPANIQVSGANLQDDVEKLRHGTAVVSVVGGRLGNAQGMEGSDATPDSRVAFQRFDFDSADGTRSYVDTLDQIATGREGLVSIINFSLGLSPRIIAILASSASDPVARVIRSNIERESVIMLRKLSEIDQLRQPHPSIPSFYIVTATSNNPEVSRDARKTSAFCEAASIGTNKTVLCIGNYDADQARVISADQNITVAAPGTNVFVAIPTLAAQQIGNINNNQKISGPYDLMTGTSFAAPLVSGILGYLRQFTDTSVFTQLKDIAVDTARIDLPGKVPVIDAYAMYWEIGNRRFAGAKPNLLRYYLADVDDKLTSPETYPDGNTRQLEDGTPVTQNSKREERGDGVLDMRDFRVLRDLFAQHLLSSTALNGGATNPKNDFNGDGCVFVAGQPCRAPEGYYSWLDLNGDGDTDPDKQAPSPRGIPGPASDLFIFRTLIDEYAQRPNPNIKKNDPRPSSLDGLLEGYDHADLIDLSPRRVTALSPWRDGPNIRGGSGDLNIKGVFSRVGKLAYDEIRISFSPIGTRPTNRGAWATIIRRIKADALEKITHTIPTQQIYVSATAYNGGKLVRPNETVEECTVNGKPGVQKIIEQLVFYVTSIGKGISQSSEKLPTKFSPLKIGEDQYYTVFGEKEITKRDCETAETKSPTTGANGRNGGTGAPPPEGEVCNALTGLTCGISNPYCYQNVFVDYHDPAGYTCHSEPPDGDDIIPGQ